MCTILTCTRLTWQERQHLVAEVQHRVDLLKKEQKKRDALAAKIKVIELPMPTYTDTLILSYSHTPVLPYIHTPILPYSIFPYSHTQAMESKLLAGGKSIVDHTDEQRRKLELQRQEVAKQKVMGSCDPLTQSCDSAVCCGAAAGAGDSTTAGGQGGGLSGDPRDVLLPQRGGGDQDQEAPQGAVSLRIRSLKCCTLSLHLSLSLSLCPSSWCRSCRRHRQRLLSMRRSRGEAARSSPSQQRRCRKS